MGNSLPFVSSPKLSGVAHGFFQTGSGAHQYGYGADGDPETIARTRTDAANTLAAGAKLAMPHQVHSPDVVTVTKVWEDTAAGRPVADALVTNQTGIALGIVTADCGPVLLADKDAGVIGAAHAGWRGAHFGVLENTLTAMESLGAQRANVIAAIGPTIAQSSYEVDKGFRAHFLGVDGQFFVSGRDDDHWQFDLPAYIAHRLTKAGVGAVDQMNLDTYALEGDYYSYRRATHRSQANYGRQMSAIALS
ncbi:MAG: peptidoglycan editing factor PgeF [Erythrobacter sp.]